MKYEFQGFWIPASVVLDKNLTPFQKLLIAEIDALSGPENGPCFASSRHLAEIMNSTDGNIRNELSDLTNRGYLIQLGSDGITTWRCVAPKYASTLGKYAAWLEDQKLPEGVTQRLQGCQSQVMGLSPTADRGVSPTTDTENASKKDTSRNIKRENSFAVCVSDKAKPSSEKDVIDYCVSLGLPASDGTWAFNHWESNGNTNGGKPIKDWKACIRAWKAAGHMASQKKLAINHFSKFTPALNKRESVNAEGFIQETDCLGITRLKRDEQGRRIRFEGGQQ